MREPDLIEKSANPKRDWKVVNHNSKAVADLILEVRRLRALVEGGRGGSFSIERAPFTVYATPNTKRPLETRDADAWRKFKVRAGFVEMVACQKTDDADGTGQTPVEIEVPDATAAYYIWVDLATPEIKHAATLPTGNIRPLAKIDTLTHTTRKRAIVLQYWTGHIFGGSGGCNPTWV